MAGIKGITGKWKNAGLAALGAAVLAVPLAGAVATPVDPTQAAPAADEAAAALSAEQLAEGRTLFQNWSCGACHALSDANGFGQIGPALDGNAAMDHAFVVSRIANGQGAMPGFGGQMTDEEIDLVSAYIMQVKK
ncbi:cytochrome c [Altererythrobacter sp. KTW20L]|uniref:c-type cytochrome n=1 Tax=Altererythrobacter sp. KTW20L TaxID=2942210 RepID=UPI0020C0DD72|nr:cytochrome c [Altererythrobacter sp. KTW20L]MCL6250749.1 cytochrome c [Altererythrobacter sp. KTW20L]